MNETDCQFRLSHPGAPFMGADKGASIAARCVDTHYALELERCSYGEWLTDLGCCKYARGGICELWTQHNFSQRQNHTDGDAGGQAGTSARATSCHSLKPPRNGKRKSWPQLKHFFPHHLLLLTLFLRVLVLTCLQLPVSPPYYHHSKWSW